MTGEETTSRFTTTGTAGPWTQRAEDRTGGRGRSRVLAWLLSPVLAVAPWLLTLAGFVVVSGWYVGFQRAFATQWGPLLGGLVVLVLAGVLWAVLTAWSSAGAIVAGAATIVFGLLLGVVEVNRAVLDALRGLGIELTSAYYVFTPPSMILVGSLLLAAGLGAAGARRLALRHS